MNGIFPQSENLDEFWEKLENGSSLITEIPNDRFDWHDYNDSHMKWGAFLNHGRKLTGYLPFTSHQRMTTIIQR